MKRTEAEYLLGGYATGTLTEVERTALFAAALEQQAIFEALLDEEALRELLADPTAKAQLLAALAPAGAPKVVPFWRRTRLLGAAASLLVASLAGLAYLRSPSALPTPALPEAVQESAKKAVAAPPAVQAPVAPRRKAAPDAPPKAADQPRQEAVSRPAPASRLLSAPPAGAVVAAMEDAARMKEKTDLRRVEAQDQLAKKAETPRPVAAAVVEVVSSKPPGTPPQGEAPERRAAAQDRATGSVPGSLPGGVIGGVIGGVVGGVPGGRGVSGVAELSPAPASAKAKAVGGLAANAAGPSLVPTWVLEVQPDGSTRVTVSAPRGQPVTLLRRGAAGVEVVPFQVSDDRGKPSVQWRAEVRLAAGEVLDLYLLNTPVAEPARLPESGPVDGFRARILPAAKK